MIGSVLNALVTFGTHEIGQAGIDDVEILVEIEDGVDGARVGDATHSDVGVLEAEPGGEVAGVGAAEDDDHGLDARGVVLGDDLLDEVGEVVEGLLRGEQLEVLGGERGGGVAEAVEAVLQRELQGAVHLGVGAHGEALDVVAGDGAFTADLQEDGAVGLVPDGGVDKVPLLPQAVVLVVEVVLLLHEPELARVRQRKSVGLLLALATQHQQMILNPKH